jgi:K+-sensing histidine kinase KdpD
MDLDLLMKVIRFPFVFDGIFYDAKLLLQNKTCTQVCKKKDCLIFMNQSNNSSSYSCSKSFNNFLFITEDNHKFMINGLIIDDNKNIEQNSFRKKYRVTNKEIEFEIEKLSTILTYGKEKVKEDSINPQFSILHDIKTSYGVILSQVELLINQQNGNSFEEKLRNCNKELSDLYDAIGLSNSQLGMIDVLVNPAKIKHGLKRSINIFKLFERISKLFLAKAKRKNLTISWHSVEQVPDAMFYDAIEFLPIVLLDNAIKYSYYDKAIKVLFKLESGYLIIKCSSFGEFVHLEDQEIIFDKFQRGRNANKFATEGIGIGLWILKQIIIAHDGTIEYEKEGSGKVGANNFIVSLKITRCVQYELIDRDSINKLQ